MLVVLLIAIAAASWLGSRTTTASAATFTYDAQAVAHVDAQGSGAAEARSTGLSDARERSASASVEVRGTSTTPAVAVVATNSAGPGAWGTANESMSERAAAFQAEVTGAAPGSVYEVGGVKFDGFSSGTLLEAKGPGPGYANFVRNGEFQPWFDGADGLVSQAQRQLAAAGGSPIRWVVAEPEAVTAIRNLFGQNGISGIDVVGR